VSVCSGYQAVDIRRFWTSMNETVPKATRVGIPLRLPEFEVLKTTMKKIEEHHPTIANFALLLSGGPLKPTWSVLLRRVQSVSQAPLTTVDVKAAVTSSSRRLLKYRVCDGWCHRNDICVSSIVASSSDCRLYCSDICSVLLFDFVMRMFH